MPSRSQHPLGENPALPWVHGARVRSASAHSTATFVAKRAMDLTLGTLLVLALLPLAIVIAVLIKLDSRGPVVFVQQRVGARRRTEDGQPVWDVVEFPFFKFRSMVADADQAVHQAHVQAFVEGRLDLNGSVKLAADPRITRVGRWLRRTSLDELPQLVNVLRGEMSLVGPRPVPPYEVAAYAPWQRERLAALPGLTGLWQVKGRGIVSFVEMVRMDIEYVRTHSIWLDVKILLATIPAVISGRGAS